MLKYEVHFDEGNLSSLAEVKVLALQLQTVMFPRQFAVTLCVLPALAVPSPLVSVKKSKNPIPGHYIVTLKDDVDHLAGISSFTSKVDSQSKVTHEWDIISGFAGTFTDADLESLRSHPNVVSTEEDGYAYTQTVVTQ